ncbi:MAG: hypothetical protein NVV66_16345 [Cellulomonas sp.]|uniref:hypothetical protein n=1 Tax=Cellulomonas sp. TaxID=40001 RepID=UPI002584C25F|nr:hypothetical protein [Cellulomonas sp.]MCR6706187.1 hypothetical protein [Cellulomonas sp.]
MLLDLPLAWHTHVARRIDAVNAAMPYPPAEVDEDDTLAIAWERAYRQAALAGASPDAAWATANAAVRVTPRPAPVVTNGREQVRAVRAALAGVITAREITAEVTR